MNAFFLYYYLLIVLLCAGFYFARSRKIQQALLFCFVGIQATTTFLCHHFAVVYTNYFKIDHLTVILMAAMTVLCFTHFLHTLLLQNNETQPSSRLQAIGFILLIVAVNSLLMAYHLLLLCAFLEAVVFAVALLIYSNNKNFEAARKYFLACSIGTALALLSVLLIIVVGNQYTGIPDLTADIVHKKAMLMDPFLLKISFLLMLSGCSAVMGVAPLFTPVVEAKENASFSTGAIISGASTIAGFVALLCFYRTFCIFSVLDHWANSVVVITGLLSLLFAALYTTTSTSFKKTVAYASLGNGGIVLIALSMEREGYVMAIVHLISHAFLMAALFYQFGNASMLKPSEDVNAVRSYIRRDPAGGSVILFAFLMLLALFPSGFALSEFILIKHAVLHGKWYFFLLMIVLPGWMFFNLAKKFLAFLYAPSDDNSTPTKNMFYDLVPQTILLLLVAWIGISIPNGIIVYIREEAILWFR